MSKILVGKHVKIFGKVPWLSLGQNTKVIIKLQKKLYLLDIHYLGTIQVLRQKSSGWVGSENGNFR